MNSEELLVEMAREIERHQFWGTWGFYGLQTLIWVSILSSTAAALLTATGKGTKTIIALLAAIPAFVLTAEGTFRYADRYQYHDKAAATITMQRNAYSIRKELTVEELSRWWDEFRLNSILPAPKIMQKKDESTAATLSPVSKPVPSQPTGESASAPAGKKPAEKASSP